MPLDAARAKPALEVRDVSKFYGDIAALRSVGLKVEPGDAVLVYGPNGAGKTTLLRVLASLVRPSEGQVLFAERPLDQDAAAAKRRIGFLSHATFLYGELTARENLKLVGRLFGLSDLEKKIDAALDLFALRDRGREPVRKLSRGLQQRVALARALLHAPDFLLLDEPFTGLDAQAAGNLERLIARLPGEGKAVVFSTHDFEQGARMARRLVALDAGRVRYDGPLDRAPLASLRIGSKA